MRSRPLFLCAFALTGVACHDSGGPLELEARQVVGGLSQPVDLQSPPGDSRLFVVEQRGRVRIIENGRVRSEPFLDLRGRVGSGFEQGLVALAFHPDYARSGRFFVNYTDTDGEMFVSELRRSDDPNRAAAESERVVLRLPQPFDTHNGGTLAFGPDGYLYIGVGDGGSVGDPLDHGQDLRVPYGKLLRIDVDSGLPYAIPRDNPFLDTPGAFPATWVYGLRNPWRFSFDAVTGDLYIGDVGQARVEEIDVETTGRGGQNYGWNVLEGSECFNTSSCDATGLTPPAIDYPHEGSCTSVTGGYVYRGSDLPELQGAYFYSDYCHVFIRSFRYAAGRVVDERDWTSMLDPQGVIESVSSFGTDARGELYIVDRRGGAVYAIVSTRQPRRIR